MAKRLVIAFDFVDEENNSLIGDLFNSNTVPLVADEVNSLDVANILMAIYRFLLDTFRQQILYTTSGFADFGKAEISTYSFHFDI